MKTEMTRDSLRQWGAGALGLVLALVLLAGLALPACADDMPPMLPHAFTGTVRVQNQANPVPEGTLVEGFVDGVKQGQTTVTAEGRYALAVGGEAGDAGKTVTFRVDGVQANETATWASGALNLEFDLTVKGSGGDFPLPLPCFIATAVYGTGTAGEIDILREFRDAALMPNRLGARFVWLYYRLSPPGAEVIARHEFLRTALRLGFIDPMVAMLNWSRHLWAEGKR